MADLDDLSFDSGPVRPPVAPPPGPPLWPIAAVAVLLVALGALWYVGTRESGSATAPGPKPVEQTTVEVAHRTAEPGDKIDLPPLDQTDALVRTLVGALSSQPVV